jgi:light-harvesting protein B-800-850 alpha chain
VDDFLSGKELGSGDMAAATVLDTPEVAKASYTLDRADGGQEITVILPDGTSAKAILQPNVQPTY